jgi:hypothetical protein
MKLKMMTVAVMVLAAVVWAAEDKDNLLKPTNKAESWRFEQHEEGKGKLEAQGDAMAFHVTNVDGTDWHVQAFQTKLDLKDGKEYVLTFKAKADAARTMRTQAGIDEEDWHFIGLDEEVEIAKDWKDFKLTFTAKDVKEKNNRVGFVLGNEKGVVQVKEMVLKQVK